MVRKSRDPDSSNKMESYSLIEHVGSGRFGDVYRANDDMNKTVVAVKKMKVCNAKQIGLLPGDFMRKIETEKDMLREFKHENIITLLDDYQDRADQYYLVLEFCAGGNLSEYLEATGPLQEREAKQFASQIKGALLYIHPKFRHGNLKPENILLTQHLHPVLKMTGFGSDVTGIVCSS